MLHGGVGLEYLKHTNVDRYATQEQEKSKPKDLDLQAPAVPEWYLT